MGEEPRMLAEVPLLPQAGRPAQLHFLMSKKKYMSYTGHHKSPSHHCNLGKDTIPLSNTQTNEFNDNETESRPELHPNLQT